VGNRSGETYQLGDQVTVKLVEVIPSAGAMRFEMRTPGKQSTLTNAKSKRSHRFNQQSRRR
jgi:ribonuclease R